MMGNDRRRLEYLFEQYLQNRINEDEYSELWKYLESDGDILSDELQAFWEHTSAEKPIIPGEIWRDKMERLLHSAEAQDKRVLTGRKINSRKFHPRRLAAAVVILLMAAGVYLFSRHPVPKQSQVSKQMEHHDLMPGGTKALLTLSNGSRVTLDSASSGLITLQGNAKVLKSGKGSIVYTSGSSAGTNVVYNMLSTPRGGTYQLVLPDGSRVWLNAASSVRFPTSFSGGTRMVEMTGEAYFEIADHASKPFIVKVDGIEVKVLGTYFNIMAYDDEPLVKTTLLNGAVRVSMGNASTLLQPGQQARIDKHGQILVEDHVDTKEIVAWKNNLFWFEDDDIQTVMRQVSRWYNANVLIQGTIPQHFTGSIPRNVKISKVFEVLQETGTLHYSIKGQQIIVTP